MCRFPTRQFLVCGVALETRAQGAAPRVPWQPLRDEERAGGVSSGLEVTSGSRAHMTKSLCSLGLWLRPCGTIQGLPGPSSRLALLLLAERPGQEHGLRFSDGSGHALPPGLAHFCVLSSLEFLSLLVLLPGALWNSLEHSGTFWNFLPSPSLLLPPRNGRPADLMCIHVAGLALGVMIPLPGAWRARPGPSLQ